MNRRKFLVSSLAVFRVSRSARRHLRAFAQASLREQLMRDPLRPQFHLLRETGSPDALKSLEVAGVTPIANDRLTA